MDDNDYAGWNSITFIIAMVGAIIGLNGIWKFSFSVYENGGGTFLIPYIIAIVVMAVPFLALEFGLGFKFKSSLPKVFYNIKEEFEIIGWFIVFLIFLISVYYACVLGWDLVYVILSLFKGWGSNPSVFFTRTLLHSTSNPYGLTYLVVPVGIALLAIWGFIYLISRRGANKGIVIATKISLVLTIIVTMGLLIYAVSLPGSRTGIMVLFSPNWDYLFDSSLWLTAFGQLIFSYGLGYGIATTYSSYLEEKPKLVDTAWTVVLVSLIFEVVFSVLVFAILGYAALGNHITITSLVSDGYSLIFVVMPTAFNLMGPWVYVVAPAFFLVLVIAGIVAVIALIEPLSHSIVEKFGWSKDRAVKNIVFIGLFASFIFATGMGEYLLRATESFLTQFAVIIAILLEIIVIGWAYGLDDIIDLLNENSFIKLDKFWIITIKFVIPIIMLILAINGIYNLIISGDRTTLFIESVIASIFVLVPLALTIIPASEDYYVEFNNDRHGFNYFNGQPTSDSKIESSEEDDSDSNEDSKDSKRSIQTRLKTKSKNIRENHDGKFRLSRSKVEEENDGEDSKVLFDKNGSFLGPFKLGRSKDNDKNVLRNVDLSSSEFDSVEEREAKLENEKRDSSSSRASKSSEEDDLDYLIDSLNDDIDGGDYDDDFDFIEVERPREISDEELARITDVDVAGLDENPKKEHKFKKSLDLDEEEEKPKPKRKSKTNTSKKVNKIKKEPKTEEIDYEDFSDDFFDDGIFGDEGYESLLDDYVPPKPKSKKQNSKQKSSNRMKDDEKEDKYYDYEAKGADSVFNLDD